MIGMLAALYPHVFSLSKLLSCDLVPSFRMGDNLYVAKPYPEHGGSNLPCDRRLLWRQSFSLEEKEMLVDMDKDDQGCRHELLRIVKAIFRIDSSTFGKLTTYHLKTVFLRWVTYSNTKNVQY